MNQYVPRVEVESATHGFVDTLGEAHHETRGYDGGDDGDEDVAECLGGALDDVALGGRSSLGIVGGASSNVALLAELLEHLVDGSCAINHLKLACCLEVALGERAVLDGVHVDLRVVSDDETKACGAVCGGDDVAGSTDRC